MLSAADFAYAFQGITHPHYHQAVKAANRLAYHSREELPTDLLDRDRPNEDPEYKAYRLNNWEPITLPEFEKIHGQVAKLQRARGLSVEYPAGRLANTIREGEGPSEYLLKGYPEYESLLNYIFTVVTRPLLDDPNGVLVVLPGRVLEQRFDLLEAEVQAGNYLQPVVTYYGSADVLDLRKGELAVICLSNTITYAVQGGEQHDGLQVLVVDMQEAVILTQNGPKAQDGTVPYAETGRWTHATGELPVLQLGSSKVRDSKPGYDLYDSFISACVPHWNDAVKRYSDHQVNMAAHLHPKLVMKVTVPCATCHGEGTIRDPDADDPVTCRTCKGAKYTTLPNSPLGTIIVPPLPPAGTQDGGSMPSGSVAEYIQKPHNDLAFLKEEYRDKLADALFALSLEYLSKVPLNQSGTAKEYDRQEVNTFFHAVATHITRNIFKPLVWWMTVQRYPFVERPTLDEWYDAVIIKVPDSFDVMSAEWFRTRITEARTGKQSAVLVDATELDYARREWGPESHTYRVLEVIKRLDPLRDMTAQEKTEAALAGAVGSIDARVSLMLPSLIERLAESNEKFFELKLAEQRKAVYALARQDQGETVMDREPEPVA